MTPREVEKLLLEIRDTVTQIKARQESDFRELYGNGKPGLIATVHDQGKRIQTLENQHSAESKHLGFFWSAIGFIVSCSIAIWALIKNNN